jgi:FAD/FMN-containing dehydrogenase
MKRENVDAQKPHWSRRGQGDHRGVQTWVLWAGVAARRMPGYDSARRIWNASIDKHPGLIVRCSDAADVVRAVKFSRANNLLVAVKSGGHNVAGRALCDDGIVIDLSAMNRVSVDPELRTVRVQAGALLGEG